MRSHAWRRPSALYPPSPLCAGCTCDCKRPGAARKDRRTRATSLPGSRRQVFSRLPADRVLLWTAGGEPGGFPHRPRGLAKCVPCLAPAGWRRCRQTPPLAAPACPPKLRPSTACSCMCPCKACASGRSTTRPTAPAPPRPAPQVSAAATAVAAPAAPPVVLDWEAAAAELDQRSPLEIMDHALATFGDEVGIAFSGAEDVALIEYAHLTGRPYRVFRWGGRGRARAGAVGWAAALSGGGSCRLAGCRWAGTVCVGSPLHVQVGGDSRLVEGRAACGGPGDPGLWREIGRAHV